MAKFLNKKEQVYDLQLTSYGHYLMSIGSFKPVYYSFLDSNILYDKRHAEAYYKSSDSLDGVSTLTNTNIIAEQQNEIHKRIKQDTQYLETIVHFDDVERAVGAAAPGDPTRDFTGTELSSLSEEAGTLNRWFAIDVLPTKIRPATDRFRMNSVIGDALFVGASQTMPAWKVAVLNGEIHSSSYYDPKTNELVPQVDINLNYTKKTENQSFNIDPKDTFSMRSTVGPFVDQKQIVLDKQDGLIYIEEVNTEILNENFEIEVFEETVPAKLESAGIQMNILSDDVDDYDGLILQMEDGMHNRILLRFSKSIATADVGGARIGRSFPTGYGGPWQTEYFIGIKEADGISGEAARSLIAEAVEYTFGVANRNGDIGISAAIQAGFYINFVQLLKGKSGNSPVTSITPTSLASSLDTLFKFNKVGTIRSTAIPSIFVGGTDSPAVLERRFFEKKTEQMSDGFMMYESPPERFGATYNSGAVEYYFDILIDSEIDSSFACKGSEVFNKSSYYLDLDFDCNTEKEDTLFYDIYGKVTEPDICLD